MRFLMKKKIFSIILLTIFTITLIGCSNKENTAPVIEYQSDGRIHVIKDAKFKNDKLKYYMFCPSEEESYDNCNWKIATSNSVDVVRVGKWYFYFKGVSENGDNSPISNVIYVEIKEEDLK